MVELLNCGAPLHQVSQTLGVSLRSVRRWYALFKNTGNAGLKLRPTLGRPRKLSSEHDPELKGLLLQGALAAGFTTNAWSSSRIVELIRARFGVRYHPDHVGRLLHSLGCTVEDLNRKLASRRASRCPVESAWGAAVQDPDAGTSLFAWSAHQGQQTFAFTGSHPEATDTADAAR